MPHRKYLSLQRQCHTQAAITGHEMAKEELKKNGARVQGHC